MNNPNCDGSGPHAQGEVRVLPTGGDSNAIFCRLCYNREMIFRKQRNADGVAYDFKLPTWDSLKVYDA